MLKEYNSFNYIKNAYQKYTILNNNSKILSLFIYIISSNFLKKGKNNNTLISFKKNCIKPQNFSLDKYCEDYDTNQNLINKKINSMLK